jgi:integrase
MRRRTGFPIYEGARPGVLAEGRDVGNDWLLPFLTVARWTGARRDELLNLERRQLDLDAGKVTLDPGSTKNGDGRAFYLPAEALGALQAWDEKTRELEHERGIIVRQVFHRHGEPVRHFPYDHWHALVTRAGDFRPAHRSTTSAEPPPAATAEAASAKVWS